MDFRIRTAGLLVLVMVRGLAFAQQGVSMSQVSPNGTITQANIIFGASNSYGAGGVLAVKAPAPGPNGTFKYWDVLGTFGSSTNYYSQPPYITVAPQPQVAVGPNDIFTVVNRSIAHYANPNAAGNTGASNPLNYPATETAWMETWLGIPAFQTLCPSGQGSNPMCVIDNISIRYDQMQGRFVVLFTVTDLPAHRSNFVLIVSRFSQFTTCPSPPTATCPSISPLFAPSGIVPIVSGDQAGSFATANWLYYVIPINLAYQTQPTALGNGVVGTATTVTTGGARSGIPFVSVPFCPNGGPALPFTGGGRSCTNYFPTGARMGLDNDNITLIAPVLDQMNNNIPEGSLPFFSGTGTDGSPFTLGPYAGTRVVTVPKIDLYNAIAPPTTPPPACDPDACGVVNLSDNIATGTLTEVAGCNVATPVVTCAPQGPVNTRTQPIRAIFWEPANLRGRALASFDSQVAPLVTSNAAGVITPIEYLVGHQIDGNTGSAIDSNQILLQPIVFSCPAAAIQPGVAGIHYCGVPGLGQIPDQPVLAPLQGSAATRASLVTNSSGVRQGLSATSLVADDGTAEANNLLFVGDSRPAQVMFREGLLYEARSVRPSGNPLDSTTVLYDIMRNCPTNSGLACNYSADGAALTPASVAQEYSWFNSSNFGASPAGFGFYAPMLESPANVANSDPAFPINVFPWLENLFVGMTTGAPADPAGTFSTDFPSLWDFRPGDDAFDTVEPYINPYTGAIATTVGCPGAVTTTGTLTNGSRTITALPDTSGIAVGMYVSADPLDLGSVVSAITPSGPGVAGSVTWSAATHPVTVLGGNTCDVSGANPGTGASACAITNVPLSFSTVFTNFCPMIPWSSRGGASTDPNDGSLWVYGEFAKIRLSTIPGPGQWGTSIANYALDFPATDPYDPGNTYFTDVPASYPSFTWIQIAKNLALAQPMVGPAGQSVASIGGSCFNNPPFPVPLNERCLWFNPTQTITRAEMAYWLVRGQMDENAVTNFLCATGGDPSGLAVCPGVPAGTGVSTFGDLGSGGSKINNPFLQTTLPGFQVVSNAMLVRYIEVMARRGYATAQSGSCMVSGSTNAQNRFCPNDAVTRGQMAELVARAKLGNIFPTSLLGGILVAPSDTDNLGIMRPAPPFFSDVNASNEFFAYIQEMRELGIANAASGTTFRPNDPVQRQDVATFIVRAFFL